MTMSPEVAAQVQAAAERRGLMWSRPDYLPRIAEIESTGNPNALHKGSGASGLFQFIPSTAKAFGLSNPFDPAAASDAASQMTLSNEKTLSRAIGRQPTDGEMYLAHQQGAVGASKILNNPGATMGALGLGRAATGNGSSPDTLAKDFAGKWVGKLDNVPAAPAPTAPGGSPMTLPGASSAPGTFGLGGPTPVGGGPTGSNRADASDNTMATLASLFGGQGQANTGPMAQATQPFSAAFGFAPLQPMRIV